VTHPFYRFIETLVYDSVTLGFADGSFQPTASAPRVASAIFTARAAAMPNGDGGIAPSGVVSVPPVTGSYSCLAGGTSLFPDVAPTALGCKHFHGRDVRPRAHLDSRANVVVHRQRLQVAVVLTISAKRNARSGSPLRRRRRRA